MKKIQNIMLTAIMALMAPVFTACTDYQDEIDALDFRITVLENLVKQLNFDLESMQVIVYAMESGDYITNVTENSEGYILTFNNAGSVVIKNGVDGINGKDGKDAQTPDISVVQGEDGLWYWTLNGELLTNEDGDPIRANGKDGQNGQDGKDGLDGKDGQDGKDGENGKDAVSPQVRINGETGIWEISIDGGINWISTGTPATGNDGKDGKDGQNGKDGKDGKDGENGKDGKDGNQFFTTVYYEVNDSGEFMVVITKAGQTFKIPIYTPKS